MRQILLITLGLSMALFADMSITGTTVSDNATELQWQDAPRSPSVRWFSAIGFCEELALDGYSDWRLPNLKELGSIVDDTRVSPAIDPIFEHTLRLRYWSSTTLSGINGDASSFAWAIDFENGEQSRKAKSYRYSVRCVRGYYPHFLPEPEYRD